MDEMIKYTKMVGRSWWIVALTTLSALSIALTMVFFTTPIYQAKAQFLITPGPSLLAGKDVDIVRSIEALDRPSISATYNEILDSSRIHNEVADELQLKWAEYSQYEISAVVLPKSSVLDLSVLGPNPEIATLLANKIGDRAISFIEESYLVYEVVSLKPAEVIDTPVNLNPARDAAVAIVMGIVFGIGLAILRESIRAMPAAETNTAQPVPVEPEPSGGSDSGSGGGGLTPQIEQVFPKEHFAGEFAFALKRQPPASSAVAIIRLDGLNEMQRTLTHDSYHHTIEYVARMIRQELNGIDLLGHMGNFSFVVLLARTDLFTANSTLQTILKKLQLPVAHSAAGHPIFLNPKIGVTMRRGSESVDILVKQADGAISKVLKPNQDLVFFTPDSHVEPTLKVDAIVNGRDLPKGPVYAGGRYRA